MREAPQTLFPKLFKTWRVTHSVFEKDTDAYARDRDAATIRAAKDAGVEVIERSGRTLWDSDLLAEKNHGKPVMSISQVQSAEPNIGSIPQPIPAPKSLPSPGETSLEFEHQHPDQSPDFNRQIRQKRDQSYESIAGPAGDFAVPTMEELGVVAATSLYRGGETIALEMLDKIVADETYTATFEKPKQCPRPSNPEPPLFSHHTSILAA